MTLSAGVIAWSISRTLGSGVQPTNFCCHIRSRVESAPLRGSRIHSDSVVVQIVEQNPSSRAVMTLKPLEKPLESMSSLRTPGLLTGDSFSKRFRRNSNPNHCLAHMQDAFPSPI